MSGDDLFRPKKTLSPREQLIADGSFGSVEDKRRYQQLLKNYQKLFRTTRRLMRLSDHNEQRISASPAVIYSFKASGDYAPLFVSNNILDVFGYTEADYLSDASFWRNRVHPDDLARVEEA